MFLKYRVEIRSVWFCFKHFVTVEKLSDFICLLKFCFLCSDLESRIVLFPTKNENFL